jgi:hypothetical protein
MDYNYTRTNSYEGPATLLLYLCCCIILLPFLAFWVWMLIDAAKRNFPAGKENEKAIWLLILLLTSPFNTVVGIGSILYYFLVKRKYDKDQPVPTVGEVIDTKPTEASRIADDIQAEAVVEDKIEEEKKPE